MNSRAYGKAPYQLVVVHGGPGAAGEMGPVARQVANRLGVLEAIQTATAVEGQIEELRQLVALRATLPAVLLGYSWGAWLSLLVAARDPRLIRKLILVSCPPLSDSYIAQLEAARLSRLTESERASFLAASHSLLTTAAKDEDLLLSQLGMLARKADSYALVEESEERTEVRLSAEIYRQVWLRAAEMRRTSELLRRAHAVICPVVAIHGEFDPSPALGGIRTPLGGSR
jgi:pimeloyl-ACP methyl ester carboxylesterase